MKIYWDATKNTQIKSKRGIGFEEIESLLLSNAPFFIEDHPDNTKYPHQKIIYIQQDDYMIAIPCVKHEDGYFCKTLFPSRKATKRFLYSNTL